MSKEPLQLHNQAEWEQAEARDLEDINQGWINEQPAREIEADVTQAQNGDVEIMPKDAVPMDGTLAIKEGADAAFMHQLVEDPQEWNPDPAMIIYPNGIPRTIAQGDDPKKRNRGSLVWYGIAANYLSAVTGDRVLIEKDGVESEWACRTCQGDGHLDEECGACHGTMNDGGGICAQCKVMGFGNETVHPSGKKLCPDCSSNRVGTGWKGRVVIPEKSQDIPMTGHIVSVGPQTLLAQLGDRVVFSKYAGHNIQNPQGSFQIMRESEILMLLKEKK